MTSIRSIAHALKSRSHQWWWELLRAGLIYRFEEARPATRDV